MRCLSLLSLACLLAACEGQSPSSSSSPARSLAAVESLDPSDVTPTSIHESASSCAYAYEPISLRGWTEQNYPVINDRPGDWVLKDDGYGVLQKNNGQPTLFASNFTVGRVNIIGRMIQSPKSDDDFFGFVLGYSLGEYRDPGAEFLLVDWKRGDQEHDFGSPSDTPGGLAEEGLALSRVNGVPTADEFWTHKDFSHSSSPVGQGLKELKRARTLGRTPWKPNVEYTFRFEMGEAGLRVFVAEGDGPESLELSMRGDYSRYVKGRFAFYNFSQSNVSYSGFKRRLRCAPVAPNSWFQTRKNVMASTVLFAASPEGPPTYVIQTYPAHGTLVQNGAALNYIPHPGYAGPDAFLWYATDEVSNSNVARVDINVINALPVAYDQSLWTRRNHAKPITLTASDADNEPLVYTLLSLPAHGTLTQNGAQVTYTPHRGYAGPDSFTFWASDSTTHGNAATVSIEVVNTPPVARDDSIVTLTTLPKDMLLPASDVDGDDLVYSIVTPPTSGTLRQAGNLVTYVPRGGDVSYYDSFTFRVSDGLAFSNTATVFVQVVNDRACLLFPGRWGPTGWLRGPRLEHTAGLLSNGQVLVSGGFVRPSELYDPAVGTWTTGGDALSTHRYHSMTLLNDGRVLVAGGEGSEAADFTEIYDPAARLWLPAARMDKARQWHTATLLRDGRVLITGGAGGGLEDPLAASVDVSPDRIVLRHHFLRARATRESLIVEAVGLDGVAFDRDVLNR